MALLISEVLNVTVVGDGTSTSLSFDLQLAPFNVNKKDLPTGVVVQAGSNFSASLSGSSVTLVFTTAFSGPSTLQIYPTFG